MRPLTITRGLFEFCKRVKPSYNIEFVDILVTQAVYRTASASHIAIREYNIFNELKIYILNFSREYIFFLIYQLFLI